MHILTFDIEDWFHIFDKGYYNRVEMWNVLDSRLEQNTDRICRFLDEKNIKATFFWLGWEAARYPHLVRKISELGHQVGAHSYFHIRLQDSSPKIFRENTYKAKALLEEITGQKVKAYRAPGMSINEKTAWAFEILSELGFEEDSSLVANHVLNAKVIPDSPFIVDFNGSMIKEFPVSSIPVFGKAFNYSSSGYFRITPSWYIQKKMMDKAYTMSYFHPRDFDIGIHHRQHNFYLKLKYRMGTRGALHKLAKISDKAEFISLQEAEKCISWDELQKITM